MKPIAREWIAKAEADFATAERELAVQVDANYDAVCFHAQQCAEKYLKAHLQEHEVPFRRTHDLSDLLDSALTITPNWEHLREDLNALTLFAVEYRYPGEAADRADAAEALKRCRKVRLIIRSEL